MSSWTAGLHPVRNPSVVVARTLSATTTCSCPRPGTSSTTTLNLGFYGQVFVVGLFLQQVCGQGARAAALSFPLMTALIGLAMLIAPWLTARLGHIGAIVLGEFAFIVGLHATLAIDTPHSWFD